MFKATLISAVFALAPLSSAHAQQMPSVSPVARPMVYVPGGHTMSLATSGGRTTLVFHPTLTATDGALYGTMLDAIEAVHPKDRGNYIGPKPFLSPLANGGNAVALDAGKYVYMTVPVKTDDRRLLGMTFWRSEK